MYSAISSLLQMLTATKLSDIIYPTLHAEGAIDALQMAVKDEKRTDKLIHHSDRGVQYCCTDYVNMIEYYRIQLSMTEKGDPYENALAERVNEILKNDYLLNTTFSSYNEAKPGVEAASKKYNEIRVHDSCDRLTPLIAHEQKGVLKRLWNPKIYKNKIPEMQQWDD